MSAVGSRLHLPHPFGSRGGAASGATAQLALRGDHEGLHVLPDSFCSISSGEQAAGETQVQLNLSAGLSDAFSLF